jgi:hypothetical protein
MRCRACNTMLSNYDLRRKNKHGQPEEYCVNCRFASDFPELLDWNWKQFEDLCSESSVVQHNRGSHTHE